MNLSHTQLNSESNVVGIFSRRSQAATNVQKIVRLAAELDGWQMLYKTNQEKSKHYSLPVLCWALFDDNCIRGMVPWLTKLVSCEDITLTNGGQWQGYYNELTSAQSKTPPPHKIAELETYRLDDSVPTSHDAIIQEIPDVIGTHAVLSKDSACHIDLIEVFSWQLLADGMVRGMIVDLDSACETPVLLGADCLRPSSDDNQFLYYFHNAIASRLKANDPETLAAMAVLTDQIMPTTPYD